MKYCTLWTCLRVSCMQAVCSIQVFKWFNRNFTQLNFHFTPCEVRGRSVCSCSVGRRTSAGLICAVLPLDLGLELVGVVIGPSRLGL